MLLFYLVAMETDLDSELLFTSEIIKRQKLCSYYQVNFI